MKKRIKSINELYTHYILCINAFNILTYYIYYLHLLPISDTLILVLIHMKSLIILY